MIKPANRYKTRLGRRTALVLYSPLIPIAAILFSLASFIETFQQSAKDFRGVWNK